MPVAGPEAGGVGAECDGGSVGLFGGDTVVDPAVDGGAAGFGVDGFGGGGGWWVGSRRHLLGLGSLGGELVEVVDDSLCRCGGAEEGFGIGLEDVEPVGEVGGAVGSGLWADAEAGGGDGGASSATSSSAA